MTTLSPKEIRIITDKLLRTSSEPEEKIVYAMCGIPASGKTTYVQSQIKAGNFPSTAFILNPDLVMEEIDGYQKDKEEHGAEFAFRRWEISARTLAYSLFQMAKRDKKAIIIDMGCAREENRQMLMSLKDMQYKIYMTHVMCDIDTAIERTEKRERFTPSDMIYKRFNTLKMLIPSYKILADEFTEIDTTHLTLEDIA